MKPQKILYVGNKLAHKGSTATAIDVLAPRLVEEGFSVISISDKKNKFMRMIDMLCTVWMQASSSQVVLIDTYSTLNFQYAVYTAKICRWKKTPYIPILHGGNLPNRLKNSSSKSKKLFGNALINVAPSHYLIDTFKAHGFTNLIHIPNTIAIDKYAFKLRKNPRARLLWVRSFSEIYNPLLAISVVKELQQQGLDVSLTMVGPQKDSSFDACKQLVETENLPVTFTGKLEKSQWIKLSEAHDIFINTTNFDNTPVSVLEAMALGLPVVSTNVGGLPFLINHDVDGVLVSPNSISAFTTAINGLLEDPETAQRIARQARQKVEKFDWDVVKQQWISLLSQ
ncbi:glycosyltransferase family 4 protein [Rasiella rasia]|uniref:Glycosyltransferase family 4 protein n=1 Tax=Rasiella rasia TaxID=2744027 RepID=A0A6G6GQ12_9FLAO|nr:glycosyltransferase family 4 protein [Rasiella rasia]QIE60639.1 glycosyltransferase family 4 protein [Rasiella rasia]